MRTEDYIRDDEAKVILGFNDGEENVLQGTGQITTFNQLGFKGVSDRPDGWYIPKDTSRIAIILETKSEKEDITNQKWVDELYKNLEIVKRKFGRVVGILYNGIDIRVFKYQAKSATHDTLIKEVEGLAPTLQHKSYYLSLFSEERIDKQKIYSLTKKINDCLHVQFGIKNLYHRMIFTACALVAKRYGALLVKNMNFTVMKNSILSTIAKSIEKDRKQNLKLDCRIQINNATNVLKK